jgi:hypothetical protein
MSKTRRFEDQIEAFPISFQRVTSGKLYFTFGRPKLPKMLGGNPLLCFLKAVSHVSSLPVQISTRYLQFGQSEVAEYRALPTISEAPSPTIYLEDSESQDLPADSFYAHQDYPTDSYVS